MTRTSFHSSISVKGAYFAHDAAQTFEDNLHRFLQQSADMAARDVVGRLQSFDGLAIRELGDHVRSHIEGRVRSHSGQPWHRTVVVSVGNHGWTARQGKSLMAAASTVEGRTHAFKRMTARMRASRLVNRAELLKGIQ